MNKKQRNRIGVPITYNLEPRTSRALRARGVTIILVVAYMGIFAVILSTITSYTFMQARYGRALYAREQAVQIAEAGLEYYRWFLSHNPNNLTNGTGQPGPYIYTVTDPESGVALGNASLTITGNSSCSVVQSIDITSRGTSNANTTYPRTLSARYMRPSVAEYSAIINANVWAGADRNITGPYHSNGGIRMDGTNNSDVTSAVATWVCDSSFGCSPTQNNANGVMGSGSGSALWRFPVPQVDFAGMATNFSSLKTYASNTGVLLDTTLVKVGGTQQGSTFSSVGGSDQRGYHVIFRSDGTIDVYRVTSTTGVSGYDMVSGWHTDYDIIASEAYIGRYTPPAGCSLIYAQAKVWIEGTVSGKVTIVAADTGAYNPELVVSNNLTYATFDGTTGLTVIAEDSIRVPLVSPDTMTMRGIFVAQSGFFGRNHYQVGGSSGVPSAYNSYVKRSSLTTTGSVVSNLRIGTKWNCGGTYCSGYASRTDNYDRILAFTPPPFTPSASADYKFVLWREQ